MKNLEKDIQRGSGNRLAEGALLLQEGNKASGHAHVSKATPLDIKRKEIQGDPQYQADVVDPAREKSTSAKRMNKDTRPL
jgi:hypothetical protein